LSGAVGSRAADAHAASPATSWICADLSGARSPMAVSSRSAYPTRHA